MISIPRVAAALLAALLATAPAGAADLNARPGVPVPDSRAFYDRLVVPTDAGGVWYQGPRYQLAYASADGSHPHLESAKTGAIEPLPDGDVVTLSRDLLSRWSDAGGSPERQWRCLLEGRAEAVLLSQDGAWWAVVERGKRATLTTEEQPNRLVVGRIRDGAVVAEHQAVGLRAVLFDDTGHLVVRLGAETWRISVAAWAQAAPDEPVWSHGQALKVRPSWRRAALFPGHVVFYGGSGPAAQVVRTDTGQVRATLGGVAAVEPVALVDDVLVAAFSATDPEDLRPFRSYGAWTLDADGALPDRGWLEHDAFEPREDPVLAFFHLSDAIPFRIPMSDADAGTGRLWFSGRDGGLYRADLASGSDAVRVIGGGDATGRLAPSPGESPRRWPLVAVLDDGRVLFRTAEGTLRLLDRHSRLVWSRANDSLGTHARGAVDGDTVAVWGQDQLTLFDARDGDTLVRLDGRRGGVRAMAAHPVDADLIAVAGTDGGVHLFSIDSGQRLTAFPHLEEPVPSDTHAATARWLHWQDDHTVAVRYQDGSGQVIDVGTGRARRLPTAPDEVSPDPSHRSADGRYALELPARGELKLVDTERDAVTRWFYLRGDGAWASFAPQAQLAGTAVPAQPTEVLPPKP